MTTMVQKADTFITALLSTKTKKLTAVARKENASAIGLAAVLSVLMYFVVVASTRMITGEFCCLINQTGADQVADVATGCSFKPCAKKTSNSEDTGFSINIGLFDGNIMDQDITVCGGNGASNISTTYPAAASYPSADTDICGHIYTVRTFGTIAIIAGCISTALAVLVYASGCATTGSDVTTTHTTRSSTAAVVALAASCVCGIVSYSVWQSKVNDQLSAMIEEDYITHWPGGRGSNVRYFRTIGYSYGALLTGWVFSAMFLIIQSVMPNSPDAQGCGGWF